MSAQHALFSGAGNVFAMVDGFAGEAVRDPAALARSLCAGRGRTESAAGARVRPDGLIVLRPSTRGADCAMEIYNADGSRPETCGNGLRCAAKLAVERGHVTGDAFTIETDSGIRRVRVTRESNRVTGARVEMGRASILALDEELRVGRVLVRGAIVDVGNPHFVLIVDDERGAPVTEWGAELERHARFAAGTNVEFLASRGGTLRLRVWERGVGETRACGSGACAAAVVALERGLALSPVRIELPGGILQVDVEKDGSLELSGPVEELAPERLREITSPRMR